MPRTFLGEQVACPDDSVFLREVENTNGQSVVEPDGLLGRPVWMKSERRSGWVLVEVKVLDG